MTNTTPNFKLQNGDAVVDTVTGYKGVITARADHLFGCARYYVQPPVTDGRVPDGCWFDEESLRLTGEPRIKGQANKDDAPGGFPSTVK